jgi:hypothetical protein
MHRETSTADFNIFLFAGSDSHFAATVGLGDGHPGCGF